MPSAVMRVPMWVRIAGVLGCMALAISPLVIGPEIAESRGFDRSIGSDLGALVVAVLMAVLIVVSRTVDRCRVRRTWGDPLHRAAGRAASARSYVSRGRHRADERRADEPSTADRSESARDAESPDQLRPRRGRVLGTGAVLVALPLLPGWIAGPLADASGWDRHTTEVAAGVFASLLFVGAVGAAVELLRRGADDE